MCASIKNFKETKNETIIKCLGNFCQLDHRKFLKTFHPQKNSSS